MNVESPVPPACVGEPLSWLMLERHALGELPPGEAARLEAHLTACAVCAACAAETQRPRARPATAPARPPWWRRYAAVWAATTAFAGVATAFLLLARAPERPITGPGAPGDGATLAGVKGGAVTLELVRERGGAITHGADTFTADDRWKALVTCPASRVMFWDVVVRDGTGRSPRFPLRPSSPIACGNHVALPGAFRLSGDGDARVCVILADDPIPRDHTDGRGICASVRPEK